ncbi:UNVERIFIED_ORG: hypothetical protein B2H98_05665 [Clostridium botulinum]|uniref:hypothetical protein n=1 Tax=Clostridium botulinum TaxID=1491 RepID=UPI0007744A6F|nr:hypothetical protein [Clostridium botulinum]MBN1037216.1 hypothetical protein [Clostridium botulinum]NFF80914.1 hypothetical protein [Clostridium botulinum]NFL86807.1 hypothetical protein [Clostridium botulinum]NFO21833.1 hypothetical protein [Clostridium botulinum]NFS29573.1 hypothetical protein [Clostridium botulinum]
MIEKRGRAGSVALKKSAEIKVRENKKKLVKALKKFQELRIPLIKVELAKEARLSVPTLNRSPYKEIIKEYLIEEKTLLSPSAKQEVSYLIKDNKKLKEEVELWKEKYKRLKKEIVYSRELFE